MYAVGAVRDKEGIKKCMSSVTGGTLHGMYFNKVVTDTVLLHAHQMAAVAAITHSHFFWGTAGRAGKPLSLGTG